ncbi:MAG: insulinase family protein [Oscillospiraceae bacterium]|jgi:predicted Zn-dependent peptidase|nr:insulinase family protein [Oscillospiraceae bacterium]
MKLEISEGINFSYIHCSKFKTSQISVTFFLPIEKETVSEYALLINVMGACCKKFPTYRLLNKRLEELYGAELCSGSSKEGDYQVLNLSICLLDDKFIADNSRNVYESAQLLCEVMFNPLVNGKEFESKVFEQEKRQLIELIESEKSDKRTWALLKCEEYMCSRQKCGIPKYGKISDIKKITPEKLYKFYEKLLSESRIEIMVLGNSNYEKIYEIFKENIIKIKRNLNFSFKTEIISNVNKICERHEKIEAEQCKLVMGFRTGIAEPCQTNGMILTSAFFGGVPTSRLFLNVREKMNLCYYCSSKYEKSTGNLFVESGVSIENLNKAKEEIINQLEVIKSGDFVESEIEDTKRYIIQKISSIEDSISTIAYWYVSQTPFGKTKTPNEFLEEISNVNKSDVINCANKIKLDTVFALVGKANF